MKYFIYPVNAFFYPTEDYVATVTDRKLLLPVLAAICTAYPAKYFQVRDEDGRFYRAVGRTLKRQPKLYVLWPARMRSLALSQHKFELSCATRAAA